MSQPLPGLSGLDKAGLQAAYLAEIGTEAGEQTVDQLRDALKAHRETQPPAAAADEPADGMTIMVDENGLEKRFTATTLKLLGETSGLEPKIAKPALAAK